MFAKSFFLSKKRHSYFPFHFSQNKKNKALADVKIIPQKQYKMQKNDLNKIKEVIEEEVRFYEMDQINAKILFYRSNKKSKELKKNGL